MELVILILPFIYYFLFLIVDVSSLHKKWKQILCWYSGLPSTDVLKSATVFVVRNTCDLPIIFDYKAER